MESDPISGYRRDSGSRRHDRNTPFERRIRVLCLLIAAPAFVLALILLWRANASRSTMWTLLGLVALLSLIAAGLLMEEIIRPLQTLANVVSALRVRLFFSCAGRAAARRSRRAGDRDQ